MKKIWILFTVLAYALSLSALAAEPTPSDDLDAELDAADVDADVFLEDAVPVTALTEELAAPSAILMERTGGTVLWEKNADERLEPASVTKVMTMLLIAEAIDGGTLSLEDAVSASAYAASMGGSQVYLKEHETFTVREMLKCIAVASANDAAVAMAEHIAGSEGTFVERMNRRAQELGMMNTHFSNCTGLPCEGEHLTTARDIAIMSAELMRHEWIREYTTIWMDSIRDGSFTLSNTNKLIYYYDGATGLKTGFTQSAGYCLSAAAERDGAEYIAVVLHCATSAERFESAKTLLSYAFANYVPFTPAPASPLPPVPVRLGETDWVQPVFPCAPALVLPRETIPGLELSTELTPEVTAPVEAGDALGTLRLVSDGEVLGEYPIVAGARVERISVLRLWKRLLGAFFGSPFKQT